jgi:hypothetical protein
MMLLSLDGADSSVAEGLVSVDEKLVVAEERPPPTPPGPHGMLSLLPEVCIYMQLMCNSILCFPTQGIC